MYIHIMYITIYECSNMYMLYNIDSDPYTKICNSSQKIIMYILMHTHTCYYHISSLTALLRVVWVLSYKKHHYKPSPNPF